MRTFRLIRDEDPTGISGTGSVAEGVEFDDGTVAMRWEGPIRPPSFIPTSPTSRTSTATTE